MLKFISTGFPKRGSLLPGMTFDEYANFYENLAVCGESSDKYIFADVWNNKRGDSSNEEEKEQDSLVNFVAS